MILYGYGYCKLFITNIRRMWVCNNYDHHNVDLKLESGFVS